MSGSPNEFVDGAGGTLVNNGTFTLRSGTAFTLTDGSESGSPITAQGGTVNDKGTGAAARSS